MRRREGKGGKRAPHNGHPGTSAHLKSLGIFLHVVKGEKEMVKANCAVGKEHKEDLLTHIQVFSHATH